MVQSGCVEIGAMTVSESKQGREPAASTLQPALVHSLWSVWGSCHHQQPPHKQQAQREGRVSCSLSLRLRHEAHDRSYLQAGRRRVSSWRTCKHITWNMDQTWTAPSDANSTASSTLPLQSAAGLESVASQPAREAGITSSTVQRGKLRHRVGP